MNTLDNYEITGLIDGKTLSDSAIHLANDLALGLERELGLIILAKNTNNNDQALAQKSIEILLDDMGFNLNVQNDNFKPSFSNISNCLHESIENINEYLIEQKQLKTDDSTWHGISLSALQIHDLGISCSMHGDACCLQLRKETLTLLGSKTSKAKSLGINPALSFTISEQKFESGDIVFSSTFELVEQLGHDFIRMTLSRFGNNLYMAIRQIEARANKKNIASNLSFLMCRKTASNNEKKGWLSKFN